MLATKPAQQKGIPVILSTYTTTSGGTELVSGELKNLQLAKDPSSALYKPNPRLVGNDKIIEAAKISAAELRDNKNDNFHLHATVNPADIASYPQGPGTVGAFRTTASLRPKFKEVEEESGLAARSETELRLLYEMIVQELERKKKVTPPTTEQEKELKEIEFINPESFLLLPQLENVQHPFRNEGIAVGSRAWLKTLDELLAVGWYMKGKKGLMEWLEESAKIVERNLNFYVLKVDNNGAIQDNKETGVSTLFNIIRFCMNFPDASRQEDRRKRGYLEFEKYIADSNRNPGISPFAPSNIGEIVAGKETDVCPPKNVDVTLGGETYKDILRHWTEFDKTKMKISIVHGQISQNYECQPPAALRYAWIPLEYRKRLEEYLGVISIRFCDWKLWWRYMLTLQQNEIETDKPVRMYDEKDKQPYILVSDEAGHGYIVKRKLIVMDDEHDAYPLQSEDVDWICLRKWLIGGLMKFNLKRFHSLLYVIMNAEAPANNGSPDSPNAYREHIYTQIYNGLPVRRMTSAAPVRAFQRSLLAKYGYEKREGETVKDCRDTFVRNIYQQCVGCGLNNDELVDDNEPPSDYRNILERLFDFGNNTSCQIPMKTVSIHAVKYEDVAKMKERQRDQLVEELKAFRMSDFPSAPFQTKA